MALWEKEVRKETRIIWRVFHLAMKQERSCYHEKNLFNWPAEVNLADLENKNINYFQLKSF